MDKPVTEVRVRSLPAARNSQPYKNRRACAGNTNCIPICPIQAKYDPTITLNEATEMQVLQTLIKQRVESADLFRKGGRPELAEKEEAEIQLLESYLPSAPSTTELEGAVNAAITETGATSAKQMGAVMKAASAKLAGKRVDGKALSELVKQRLKEAERIAKERSHEQEGL